VSGNTFGQLFRVTTFGESHGPAVGCVIDGCPPGLPVLAEEIDRELLRRRPGQSRYVTQRKESDRVEILSGLFEGMTTGTPIALLIKNENVRSVDYEAIKDAFRPGHADYTYWRKYGLRDWRGGGRSSARETAARVAAGAVAKKWLYVNFGITIRAFLSAIGPIDIPFENFDVIDSNPFFAPNQGMVEKIADFLDDIRKQGDSIGAKVTVVARPVPPGLGEPVFDKLDAQIAAAMMSINAVKAVAIGDGFSVVHQKGSEHGDEIAPTGFLSNHAGGILGGISTGQDIVVHLAIKPTSSITIPRRSIDRFGNMIDIVTKGRHDPCVGIRAVPVSEAMLAIVLMDQALRQRAQSPERLNHSFL
jgi:chorismate synthase